jgi:hypothetical protein
VSDEEKTPVDYWQPPSVFERGLGRVRKGWAHVWQDTRIVNGSRKVSRIEFAVWVPVLVLITPVLFVLGMSDPSPVPLLLACPSCHVAHVDRGSWRTRSHRTHRCEACGIEWRPTDYPTVGV